MAEVPVVGSTVKNKFNNRLATVTGHHDDGNIRVRFDGEEKSVVVHHTHFRVHSVALDSPASKGPDPSTFKRGDYLSVEIKVGRRTVQGTALTTHGMGGYATFELLTDGGEVLNLNSNFDKFTVLFRADIARGDDPKY